MRATYLQMNLSIATGRVDGCLGGIKKGVAVADSTRAAALFAAETKNDRKYQVDRGRS